MCAVSGVGGVVGLEREEEKEVEKGRGEDLGEKVGCEK